MPQINLQFHTLLSFKISRVLLLLVPIWLNGFGSVSAQDEPTVTVGRGSYLKALPQDVAAPPERIYRTDRCPGPMPTNDWWSSLAWEPFSSPMFPHPLAVKAVEGGLQVNYPGPSIVANQHGIIGGGGYDLQLGHSEVQNFGQANLDSFSDWFVTASFQKEENQLLTTFGHGSPFVFVKTEGGSPAVSFSQSPVIWSGKSTDAVLGISIGNRHYGLFAPSGSHWKNLQESTWSFDSNGANYFSIALLPDNRSETLQQFTKFAYSHVVDSRVDWHFDSDQSVVNTQFEVETDAMEGQQAGTLFALYPHQWLNLSAGQQESFSGEYASVRGPMKLIEGEGFATSIVYHGVLPSLPVDAVVGQENLRQLVRQDVQAMDSKLTDTYWFGKKLGYWATLLPLAQQLNDSESVEKLTEEMKLGLEDYFQASQTGDAEINGVFAYDQNWGTLIGYPDSFGSANELNDHHFHYGYFIRAAGEIARRDPEWASEKNWGGMVRLLIRDVTTTDRQDPLFPFMRNFDPYAGHTWASGHGKFGDGNNNESSSEAINAWYGIILFAEATGDQELRDLGIYLLTTEIAAIQHYWFDVTDQFHHPDYDPSVVTMVWGGKGANATWFSGNPEMVHGINWLPITGGSLYLGLYPDYCQKNYEALYQENLANDRARPKQELPVGHQTGQWDVWSDLMWMYRALSDPADAMKQFETRSADFKTEAGNSLSNTLVWISFFQKYGHVDRTITADTTFYAVMEKGGRHRYFAWNLSDSEKTVSFSDGTKLQVKPNSFAEK